jgi:RNA polymerase sigma factor (sigma-70 family)
MKSYNTKQIEQLVEGCLHGNERMQQLVFMGYRQQVFSTCLRYARDRPEAEDMMQEAFLCIFRDLRQFRGTGSFEGWLRKVTVRNALQYLRRRNPLRFAEDYEALPVDFQVFTPDSELNNEALLTMVQQLPVGYRTVFNLRCVEDFSYAEIADELGIAESSVRSQYARACKCLRDKVERFFLTV